VTERGQPVALLTPLPERMSARERLIAAGRIRPGRGHASDLGSPLEDVQVKMPASQALDEQREERLP
jgi:antitoxin (DNA-binding transcriptional repressor) of toxin-antitoxin stability system